MIGAQKSGTTSLSYLLAQHPDICVASPKEPHFFSHNWDKGIAWYRDCFCHNEGTIFIDASTTYAMAPVSGQGNPEFEGIPRKIHQLNPEAKFIYLLRDPVERAYSGYWHSVRTGRETRPFREAIERTSRYLDVSDYHQQLLLYLAFFKIDAFLFLLFEDLKTDPGAVARRCFRFLGLDDQINVGLDEAKNRSAYVGSAGRKLNAALREVPMLRRVARAMGPVAPAFLKRRFKRITTGGDKPIPPMSAADRAFLADRFRESNRQLAELTGLRLDRWTSFDRGPA